jgi:hypothetical protein
MQPADRLLGNPESILINSREIISVNFALAGMKFALLADRTVGEVITAGVMRRFAPLCCIREERKCQSEDLSVIFA